MNGIKNSDIQKHRSEGRGRRALWLLAGVLALTALLFAFGPHGQRDSVGGLERLAASPRHVERVLNELDATEAQRATVRRSLRGFQSALAQVRVEEAILREGLVATLQSGDLGSETVARVRAEAVGLSESAIDIALQSAVEIWQTLTPDQRAEALRHWDGR